MSAVPRRNKTFSNRSIHDMAVRAGAAQLTHHDGTYALLRRLMLTPAYRVLVSARALARATKRSRVTSKAMRLALASMGVHIHGHRDTPGKKTKVGKTFALDGKRAARKPTSSA